MPAQPTNKRHLLLASLLLVAVVLLAISNVRSALSAKVEEPILSVGRGSENRSVAELARLTKKFGAAHYSWHQEELIIREFFDDVHDGVFLDVGAYDYKQNSNTYYLEKELGWSGIAIDAQDQFKDGYLKYRPRSKFMSLFVTDHSGGMASFYVDLDDDHQSTGVKQAADERHRRLREVKVPMITLNDLLDKESIKQIDLLSIDIEQGEPAALRGFDIQRFKPKLVCIEATVAPIKEFIARYFTRAGYVRLPTWSDLDGYNDYYTPLELADKLTERYERPDAGQAAAPQPAPSNH